MIALLECLIVISDLVLVSKAIIRPIPVPNTYSVTYVCMHEAIYMYISCSKSSNLFLFQYVKEKYEESLVSLS